MPHTLDLLSRDELSPGGPDDAERGLGALSTERGCLPLRSVSVHARIAALVAHTSVRQTFVNPYEVALEATYVFPLPERAAVTGFRVRVAGRVVEGSLRARDEARAEYDAALAQGQRAAIAEAERPEVFTLRVGNLMPGERAEVQFTLCGALPCERGEATFRFPLVVAPRFVPGSPLGGAQAGDGTHEDTDAVPDASRISPPVLLPGFPSPVRLALSVDLVHGARAPSRVRSSLHAVEATTEAGVTRIEVRPGQRLDRDFVLRFDASDEGSERVSFVIAPDPAGDEATFSVLVAPPRASAPPTPRDVVLVLDRSGSMAGWKMVAARRALARMVEALDASDRFAVIAFDTSVEGHTGAAKGALTPATDAWRFRAAQFLAAVEARGGTHMGEPLTLGLELLAGSKAAGREAVLVLVTDGQVGNEEQLVRALAPRLRDARVFALGIDRAVNAGFLTQLAALGRGRSEVVESEERLDETLDAMHRAFGVPVLTELQVQLDGAEVLEGTVTPERGGDVFPGVPLRVMGRARLRGRSARDPGARALATVRARRADGRAFTARAEPDVVDSPALAAVWAREKLRALEDRHALSDGGERDRIEREAVELSLRQRVLSKFTAFVAVDSERVLPSGSQPHRAVQPVETPSGWASGGASELPPAVVSSSRARAADSVAQTRSGGLRGKVQYGMSPEKLRGRPCDARHDVYCLAVVLYTLLTGKRLFDGASEIEIIAAIANGSYPSPLLEDRRLAAVEAVLRRALAPSPEERYPTLAAFGEALRAARLALPAEPPTLGALVEAVRSAARARPHAGGAPFALPAAVGPYTMYEVEADSVDALVTKARRRGDDGREREVQLRIMHDHLAIEPEAVERFLNEARVPHPAAVQVLETGLLDGRYFVALEAPEGATLGSVLAQSRRGGVTIAPGECLRLVELACDVLASVEGMSKGAPHGNLDLYNLYARADGTVQIADFGPATHASLLAPRVEHRAG